MFVQLGKDECTYLLNLIEEMDSATPFTERQRGYTVPKLQRIQAEPRSARLAYQDVKYLLELIEDDELEELEQIRGMAKQTLYEIEALQAQKTEEMRSKDEQREFRRLRRLGPRAVAEELENALSTSARD